MMTGAGMISSDEVTRALNRRIDEVLGPLLSRATRCALVDFPNHSNVGDSAIWLGERAWLRRNRIRVTYVCDADTYAPEILTERLGDGCILFHGGGNLGDLWTTHQRFRERVIQDFPDRKIIQLPQSILFKQRANLERAQQVFNGHSNLTLLLRDRPSLELAREEFTATSLLCPDMAFSLGAISRPSPPRTQIIWLSRTDKESPGEPEPITQSGLERVDWLEETPTGLRERNKYLTERLRHHPEEWQTVLQPLSRTYDLLARERLRRGCRLLSRGSVVVSNRLHAHILSLLMGIPHVLLDNSYGKVKNFHDCWTKNCEIVRYASSPQEVVDQTLREPQFRLTRNAPEGDRPALDELLEALSSSIGRAEGWSTEEALVKRSALLNRRRIEGELIALIPAGQSFLLVDEDQIRTELQIRGRRALPFLERDEQYWGPPPDDDTAIRETERMRKLGATFMVFAWPAFWWLDYYQGLGKHLVSRFRCVLRNERLVVFDLRS